MNLTQFVGLPTTAPTNVFTVERYDTEDAWLDARKNSIGASEVSAVLGINPYCSPLRLYTNKIGLETPFFDNPSTMAGRYFEDGIAAWYADVTGAMLADPGRYTLLRSVARPYLTCTLDRVIVGWQSKKTGLVDPCEPIPLELKLPGARMADQWTHEPPAMYQAQNMAQIAVTGAPRGVIACAIDKRELQHWTLPRDNDLIETVLYPRIDEFWDRVLKRKPPEADGSPSSGEAIKALYPREIPGRHIQLPPESADLHIAFLDAKRRRKDAEADEADVGNKLRMLIGDFEKAYLPDGTAYKFKAQERSGASCKECGVVYCCPECGVEMPKVQSRPLLHVKS